jgi:transposase
MMIAYAETSQLQTVANRLRVENAALMAANISLTSKNTSLEMELTSFQCKAASLEAEIQTLSNELKWLKEQIGLSRKLKFGASSEKSEYDYIQTTLFNDGNAAEILAPPDQSECENIGENKTTVKAHTRKTRLVTDKLPPDTPTETIEYTLPEEERVCPECGDMLHPIGKENIRDEIKIVPAKIILVKHVRTSYGCRNCETEAETPNIIKPPMPEPVIKGSFASPEAIAYLMVQKYVMGLPLYRMESEFLRQGINLSRQTMSNWMITASEVWLAPIYDLLYIRLLTQDALMCDETTLQVIKEPGRAAQQTSYLWIYRTVKDTKYPTVICEYQPGRGSKYPAAFLSQYKGYLHVDGYEGYHNLSRDIIIVGCFSHARRLYDQALKIIPAKNREGTQAMRGKRYCDALFDIEKMLADMSPDERYLWRLVFSKPVLDEYYEWLQSFNFLGKTLFAKAVNYSLEQWKYLKNYLLDGRLELSNNRTERTAKAYVIDRKNFLFAFTPRGATSSAIIFSIIQTAVENGLNPYEYLSYIFTNAPNWRIMGGPDFAKRLLPEMVPEYIMAPSQRLEKSSFITSSYKYFVCLPGEPGCLGNQDANHPNSMEGVP